MAEITLAKALKIKNRLTGRLAKVQTDIQAYNSVLAGQADQANVLALMQTCDEPGIVFSKLHGPRNILRINFHSWVNFKNAF